MLKIQFLFSPQFVLSQYEIFCNWKYVASFVRKNIIHKWKQSVNMLTLKDVKKNNFTIDLMLNITKTSSRLVSVTFLGEREWPLKWPTGIEQRIKKHAWIAKFIIDWNIWINSRISKLIYYKKLFINLIKLITSITVL